MALCLGRERHVPVSPGLRPSFRVRSQLTSRHINNVTYARYIESARMRWVETLESDLGKEAKDDLVAGRGLGIILKEQTIRFRYPVTYPDSVS